MEDYFNCFCPNCGKYYLKKLDAKDVVIANITQTGVYILFCDECINNPQEFDERELEF